MSWGLYGRSEEQKQPDARMRDSDTRAELRALGHVPLDLTDLLEGL
jgi:hypothetical protein